MNTSTLQAHGNSKATTSTTPFRARELTEVIASECPLATTRTYPVGDGRWVATDDRDGRTILCHRPSWQVPDVGAAMLDVQSAVVARWGPHAEVSAAWTPDTLLVNVRGNGDDCRSPIAAYRMGVLYALSIRYGTSHALYPSVRRLFCENQLPAMAKEVLLKANHTGPGELALSDGFGAVMMLGHGVIQFERELEATYVPDPIIATQFIAGISRSNAVRALDHSPDGWGHTLGHAWHAATRRDTAKKGIRATLSSGLATRARALLSDGNRVETLNQWAKREAGVIVAEGAEVCS